MKAAFYQFITVVLLLSTEASHAQFIDNFNNQKIQDWNYFTGDGDAVMKFIQKDGYARIFVDASNDKYNIWWAITKRNVTPYLDLNKLTNPDYELRVEAKVRVSHAPKRINFMINTQRTTNFHEHLMEYEIPDTANWHTISYTTKKLDAVPGDSLYVQLDMTDWGAGKYYVDVDYYKADIVNINESGPDLGEALPYHPPVPNPSVFSNHLAVNHDAVINPDFPDVNFNDWHTADGTGVSRILTVDGDHYVILRWDFSQFEDKKITGSGLLELTTHLIVQGGNYFETFGDDLGMEFGKVRVFEIYGGDPNWDQTTVTYNRFLKHKEITDVFNSQMIFDFDISVKKGGKNYITISRPVLQRILDGKTKGLLLRPLGALNASFYSSENSFDYVPKLHFDIK